MKKTLYALALGIGIVMATTAFADDSVDPEDATMNAIDRNVEEGRLAHFRQHSPMREAKKIIDDYIQAQIDAGELDPAVIEQGKAQRLALVEEIKALKAAGDQEALAAKVAELRALRHVQRDAMREYIASNDELRDQLAEHRDEVKEKRAEHREQIREKRTEHRDKVSEKRAERRDRIREHRREQADSGT